jgi:alpha-1,2-mannosyltransferase
VWAFVSSTTHTQAWPRQVNAIAAATPALWFVALHGQVSALALAALAGCWYGLQQSRPWLAGAALGLLAFKPSLYVPALAVCVLAGEWRIALGAGLVGIAQFSAALPWAGASALAQWVATTLALVRAPDLVASNPAMMHSLRTFWSSMLPGPAAATAYALTGVVAVVVAARAWRRALASLDRVAVLALAIVLASPHLFAYDLLILAPAFVASAERLLGGRGTPSLRVATYASYLAPIWGIPLAAMGAQASTLALAWWLSLLARSDGRLVESPARRAD